MRTTFNLRSKRGFSLVEVLIALIVMSVGMLGIASLYVQGMQAGRTSTFRHHAVTLAGDVADRIRANPTAGAAYAAATGMPHGCVGLGTDCTPAEMAAHDILIWQDQAAETLPAGEVAVTHTVGLAGAPDSYQIDVTWDEPNPLGGNSPSFSINIPVLDL